MPAAISGRAARDKKLALAAGALILAGLLALVADSLRLAVVIEARGIAVEYKVSGWLAVISDLPILAAAALALVAFSVSGEARRAWLYRAFLLAALAFGIEAVAEVLSFMAVGGRTPHGLRVAMVAAILTMLALSVAALLAASAFSAGRGLPRREALLRRGARAVGAAYAFAAISALEYAVAYSHYPHHVRFGAGLVIQGLGGLGVALAAGYGATAFRRKGEGLGEDVRLLARERRLFFASAGLGLAFLVVALGEGRTAAGTTAVGYSESAAVASWILALGRLLYVAAVACAAVGFRRAANAR